MGSGEGLAAGELTEQDGRWYSPGSADCKGNIVMHLTALRALGDDVPVGLKLIVEGSEKQATGGMEDFVPRHAAQLSADAILVCDTGGAAVGHPAATIGNNHEALRQTVRTFVMNAIAPSNNEWTAPGLRCLSGDIQ